MRWDNERSIWHSEDIEDLDRAMILRVSKRSTDLAYCAFMAGLMVGVLISCVVAVAAMG